MHFNEMQYIFYEYMYFNKNIIYFILYNFVILLINLLHIKRILRKI